MYTVYVYVLDTQADWELGYVTAELGSGRFFKKDAPAVELKTVGLTREPVKTMGGLTVTPDCTVGDIAVNENSVLLLPGGNTWSDEKHVPVLQKAGELLATGAAVCAICGATVALACCGVLDTRRHTSNGPGFLEMFAPGYRGAGLYVDEPAAADGNLITAAGTGALSWAKLIIERLGVFAPDTLSAWYDYFSAYNPRPEQYYALLQTLPAAEGN